MFTNRTRRSLAFTLIELLIVVAIIAILAAIAVPNFLAAQARAKVSRAKADMRTLATAIESYAVDNNVYPIVADEEGNDIFPYPGAGPAEIFETRLSTVITTPISYITSRLAEPFPEEGDFNENPQFGFLTRDYAFERLGDPGEDEFTEYIEELGGQPATAKYYILSHGPDRIHDEPEPPSVASLYDPTNGTISSGDILYFGPGQGFQN